MRRGCTTSTRGRLSAFVDFDVDADGDAAKYRSATMPTTPIAINATKALMLFRAIKFIRFMVGLQTPFLLPAHSAACSWRSARPSPASDWSRAAVLAQNRAFAGRQGRAMRKPGHAPTRPDP